MGGGTTALKAVGSAAWEIVKEGVDVSSAGSFTGAIPSSLNPSDLHGWKTKSGTWSILTENFLATDVIDVKLKYSFDYNGQNAKFPSALFVNNFTIYCVRAEVMTPYTCTVSAKLNGRPRNAGPKDSAIAAVPLQIKQVCGNPQRKVSETFILEVDGAGNVKVK